MLMRALIIACRADWLLCLPACLAAELPACLAAETPGCLAVLHGLLPSCLHAGPPKACLLLAGRPNSSSAAWLLGSIGSKPAGLPLAGWLED